MSRWLLALLIGLPLFFSYPGGATAAIAEPDGSDDAWALIRANTPADRAVYRPTWLLTRFTQAGLPSPRSTGLFFGVTYTSTEGDVLFFGTSTTSAATLMRRARESRYVAIRDG